MTSDQQVAVPVPGQLVTVRNRQWVAADVSRGEVASSDPNVLTGRAPHLVTLAGIEDDARDEELSVVWELAPGAVVHDVTVLPSPEDGFNEPSELAAFLHAVHWARSPRPTPPRCRPRSAPAFRSRTISWTRWCARCPCRAPTC